MLKDLTLWHWWFFLYWGTPLGTNRTDRILQEFGDAVADAVRWAGGPTWKADTRAVPPLARQASVRYASEPWRPMQGVWRTMEARALLDALYVQAGCYREGVSYPNAIEFLKQAEWIYKRGADAFLGDAVCLTGELVQTTTVDQAKDIAQQMLGQWFGRQPPPQLSPIELPCGYFAVPVGVQEEAWVLLVHDKDQARDQAAHLLHRLLPPMLLAWVKSRFIMQEFEGKLLPDAETKQDTMDAALNSVRWDAPRLRELENLSEAIAKHHGVSLESLSLCEERLETLRTNATNVERLLDDSLLASNKTRLDALLVEPLRLNAQQIHTDLRYLSVTHAKAEQALRSIETIAQVRAGRVGRNITILFGLFVVFDVLKLFPEISLQGRILAVIGGFLVLVGLIWWITLKRRKGQ